MKKMVLGLAVLLGTVVAQAENFRGYHVVDMTGKRFRDDTFNQMDDGIDTGNADTIKGYAVKLEGKYQRDFVVESHGSEAKIQCSVKPLAANDQLTVLVIDSGIETDSGETCDYTVIYRNGRKATLQVFEEGT